MMIYTGHSGGKRADKCAEYGLGFMLHSCPTKMPSPDAKTFRCALDNGAVSCWRRGYPFQGEVFMAAKSSCRSSPKPVGISPAGLSVKSANSPLT